MFRSREPTWIGFEEAQKTIDALKDEVQLAEGKLYNAKRTLKFDRKLLESPVLLKKIPQEHKNENKTKFENKNRKKHFVKETIFKRVPQNGKLSNKQKSVKRLKHNSKEDLQSDNSPIIRPSKEPYSNGDKIGETLAKCVQSSALSKISSSDTSSSLFNSKSLSTDGTSSLIQITYKDIDARLAQVIQRCEVNEAKQILFTSWEKEYLQKEGIGNEEAGLNYLNSSFIESIQNDPDEKSILSKATLLHRDASTSPLENIADGLEWIDAPKGKVSHRSKHTSDPFQNLRSIIHQQKKTHEEFQFGSETDHYAVKNSKAIRAKVQNGLTTESESFTFADTETEAQLRPPPTRKMCTVSTIPKYRGFNLPFSDLSAKRTSKHRKKAGNGDAAASKKKEDVKQLRKSVRNNNNFISVTDWKKPDKNVSSTSSEEKKQSSKSSLENKTADNVQNSSLNNNNLETVETSQTNVISVNDWKKPDKNVPSTSSEEKKQSSKSSLENKTSDNVHNSSRNNNKLETVETNDISSKTQADEGLLSDDYSSFTSEKQPKEDSSSKKENIKPKPIRSIKRKATKVPDQVAPSPKIRHYDVKVVRNYIRKKKEERKKRSLEEHKKSLQDVQNKKDRLQKLYNYQKQNVITVPQVKPTSPLKSLQNNHEKKSNEMHTPTLNSKSENTPRNNKISLNQSCTVSSKAQNSTQSKEILLEKDGTFSLQGKPDKSKDSQNKDQLERSVHRPSKDYNSEENRLPNQLRKKVTESSELNLTSLQSQSNGTLPFTNSTSSINQSTETSDTFHEKFQFEAFKFPSVRTPVISKETETLKHLLKSISDQLAEPLDQIIRTKKWVEESPPPPSPKQNLNHSSSTEKSLEVIADMPKASVGFIADVAKSLQFKKNSTFRSHVTDIGDTSQLYEKILGNKSNSFNEPVNVKSDGDKNVQPENSNFQSDDDGSLVEGSLNSDEELEEGSLKSDEELEEGDLMPVQSMSPPTSSFNTGLTVLRQTPDPFNFINTWNRKPLGISIVEGKLTAESREYTSPTQFTESLAKSNSVISQSRNSYSQNSTENTSRLLSSHTLYSSDFSENEQNSEKSSRHSGIKNENETISQSHTSLNRSLSKTPNSLIFETLHSELNISSKFEESRVEDLKEKDVSRSESSISEIVSIVENSVHEDSTPPLNGQGITSNSYSTGNRKKKSAENSSTSKTVTNTGQVMMTSTPVKGISRTLDDVLGDEKEMIKSGDSAQSSNVTKITKSSDSIPESIGAKTQELGKVKEIQSDSSKSNDIQESLPVEHTASSNSPIETVSSSFESKRTSKEGNIISEEKILENISSMSSTSPNSVTIDFTQPVRFTLANNLASSLKFQKGSTVREEPYFPSQVVIQVAAEAAAAAVTAVMTQKDLLALENKRAMTQKHESSQSLSSSSHKESYEDSSSSHSKSPKSNESSEETIMYEVHEEISPVNTVKEVVDHGKKEHHTHSVHNSASTSSVISEEIPKDDLKKSVGRTHVRKISGNFSSPSPASLSENESISSITQISSHSALSDATANESVHSDDSFAQLTLDVVRRMTHEEESRARHQLLLLKMQEKTLVENSRERMTMLEVLKKKLQEKGADKKKVSVIKKRQKELISRLRQERVQLKCMQEAYRSVCEKHQSMLADKRKLLNEPSSLAYQMLHKKEKSRSSKPPSQIKTKERWNSASSNSTIVTEGELQTTIENEEEILEVPEISKSRTSNSSHGSIVETETSGQSKSISSQNNSLQTPTAPPQLQLKHSNTISSVSNHSIEQAVQRIKKLEASKRHLTKREQRIFQRKQNVEKLIQWKNKLDSEEMAVRELELKAVELVDGSKKKTKYYVTSSSSANPDATDKVLISEEIEKNYTTQSSVNESISSEKISSEKDSNEMVPGSTPSDSVPEENLIIINSSSTSGSSVEEKLTNKSINESEQSSSSIQEMEANRSDISSIKNMNEVADSSNIEEISVIDMSSNMKSPVLRKSSSSEIYSELFDSPISKKTSSPIPSSPETKTSTPSNGNKKDKGFSIRSPLVPRSMRRHDSSGSDDSYTISHSETASDQSDIEGRIHALAEQLRRRKAEAEKLKREHKKKYREKLKEKELSLQKQLEAYNQYIEQTKMELESQVEAVSSQSSDITTVKPQIKWPRPETVLSDSRRLRKRASIPVDSLMLEPKKISDTRDSHDLIEGVIGLSNKKEKDALQKVQPDVESKETKSLGEDVTPFPNSNLYNVSGSSYEIPTETDSINNVVADLSKHSRSKTELSNKSTSEIERSEEIESHDSSVVSAVTDEFIPEKDASASETESKSSYPSDSFVSDSSYSKSENESNEKTEEKPPSKSQKELSSLDEELYTGKSSDPTDDSHEDSDKSNNSDPQVEEEIESEVEYVSEASSITVTGSVKDSENKKCDNSDGCCESSPTKGEKCMSESSNLSKSVSDNTSLKQLDLESTASSSECAKQKLQKSSPNEIFVTHVVNYLYNNVFDDSIKSILSLSQNGFVIGKLKSSKKVFSESTISPTLVKSESTSKKKTETDVEIITSSLFNQYLQESISTILKISSNFKRSSGYENVPLQLQGVTPRIDANDNLVLSKDCDSVPSVSDENYAIHKNSISSISNDDAESSIFRKDIDWFEDGFVTPLSDRQQLEQQMLIQQYPFYYRKIPNKPPPPYTPPTVLFNSQSVLQLNFKREKPIIKVDPIIHVTQNISLIVAHIAETLIAAKEKGCMIQDITDPDFTSIIETLELEQPCQLIFLDLIFDVAKEIILDEYCETKETILPWIKPKKLTPKPLFPCNESKILPVLQKKIEKTFKLKPKEQIAPWQRKRPTWSTLKLGRKKRDFVDTVLISEIKNEEPDWINYDQDEVTVKFQIADSILDLLVDDTINTMKELEKKIIE